MPAVAAGNVPHWLFRNFDEPSRRTVRLRRYVLS
jgi:hypothetical protein